LLETLDLVVDRPESVVASVHEIERELLDAFVELLDLWRAHDVNERERWCVSDCGKIKSTER